MTARVTDTFLRGERIFENGNVVGKPRGEFVRRPSLQS
jgi:allantoinase